MSVSVSVSADAASEASREWLLFHTQVLFVQGCRARVARLCGPGAKVGWRLERRSSGAGASQEGRGGEEEGEGVDPGERSHKHRRSETVARNCVRLHSP